MLERKLWPEGLTDDVILAAVERSMVELDDPGYCLSCGAEAHGVEGDARRYKCESCGDRQVYGIHELVMSL